jgi:uncharacterized repeat protein (TIGR01451 family)
MPRRAILLTLLVLTASVRSAAGQGFVPEATLFGRPEGLGGQPYGEFGAKVAVSGDTLVVGAPGLSFYRPGAFGEVYVYVRSGSEWSLQQKLRGSDTLPGEMFGSSMAIDGDTLVVGAYLADRPGASAAGAAYVFVRTGTTWTEQQKLLPAEFGPSSNFGQGVSVSGDTAVITTTGSTPPLGAWVFERSGTTWTERQKLLPADVVGGDDFDSVSILGDTLVVGAGQDDNTGTNSGSAYVYARENGVWIERQKLLASDASGGDEFGESVAMGDGYIVIGAWGDDPAAGANAGSAYVFVRSGTIWSQQQKLVASNGDPDAFFGDSVSIAGDTIVVGAPQEDHSALVHAGAAYAFVRSGSAWIQQQRLVAPDAARENHYGTSVAVWGDTAVVGAPWANTNAGTEAGKAYAFPRADGSWGAPQTFRSTSPPDFEHFGRSVAISGDTAVVGVEADWAGGVDAGAAYVFVRTADGWIEQQKLTPSDPTPFDFFGESVAVSGDTLVVGAPNANTPIGSDTGAVYVFVRSGSVWTEQQKLTAPEASPYDLFGGAVSVSGDTMVVGARGADTPAGISAGAAWVFVRSGGTWSAQQKLTASDGAASDLLGGSVSISGDTALIGSVPQNAPDGSAYVFVRSGATWSQQQKLASTEMQDRLGGSVSVWGDIAVVGAHESDAAALNAGAAYVYVRSVGSWSLSQRLLAPAPNVAASFGWSVSTSGDHVVVGALGDDNSAGIDAGSAYVFARAGASWVLADTLRAPGVAAGDSFGSSVAADAGRILVGAPNHTTTEGEAGSAYVFRAPPQTEADLFVIQTDSLDPVAASRPVTYIVSLTNYGPETAHGVTVTDTLPAGVVLQSASGPGWTCAPGAVVTCVRPALDPGVSPPILVVVTAPAIGGILTNTVTVGHLGTDPLPANNSSIETTTVAPPSRADLAVSQSDSPDPVERNNIVTYTLSVTNLGPEAAPYVSVVDVIPAESEIVSVSGGGWTCDSLGRVAECQRPTLAAGPAPPIEIVVAMPTAGILTNTASVSHLGVDPVAANNDHSETTTVTPAPPADLSITLADGGVEARWGQPFTWTITVANAGPQPVNGASVADTFPAEVTGLSWTCSASSGSSCPSGGSGNIAASVSLPVGGSATFTATGTVVPGTDSLTNSATVTPPAGIHDHVSANNSASVTTDAGPIGYYVLTPCRVVDTRTSSSPLAANSTRSFAVSGACAIPADARAVAVILTAVNPGDFGNLRLFPTGQPLPQASAINFTAGITRANNAILPLGVDGRIEVRCDMPPGSIASTHFVLDVSGYFR